MPSTTRFAPGWLPVALVAALLLVIGMLAARASAKGKNSAAPMAKSAEVKWDHAPYAAGACATCHVSNNAKKPGKLKGPANALCVECHDEFLEAVKKRKYKHESYDECTNCHNAHNAADGKLLLQHVPGLCFECHDDVKDAAKHPKGKKGKSPTKLNCAECHDPHAAAKSKLRK